MHRDGAFAEYVVVPAANAWPDPVGLPLSVAALQENFGNAVHSVSVPVIAGRKVMVTGCGPVGLMAIAAARALGARSVLATDISAYRLGLAKQMGADLAVDAADGVEAIWEATEGEGVDVLLEMSGSATAMADGFGLLKPGGEAALLGLPPAPISFDIADNVIFKGATIHGIFGRRLWDDWYEMRGLLRSGAVDLAPLVTHRFALDDYRARLRPDGVGGVRQGRAVPRCRQGGWSALVTAIHAPLDFLRDQLDELAAGGLAANIRTVGSPQGARPDGRRPPGPQLHLERLFGAGGRSAAGGGG